MSKYDSLKFLKETKAIKPHDCNKCGRDIEKERNLLQRECWKSKCTRPDVERILCKML